MGICRIYIVEDDPIIADELSSIITDLGYEVCGISYQPFEARKQIEALQPELLLLDINLNNEIDGIDLATLVKNAAAGIVFISAFTDKQTLERVKHIQPLGYIIKPFNDKDVEIALGLAVNAIRLVEKPQPESKNDHIFVKTKNNTSIKVGYNEICFLEAYDTYAYIHTMSDKFLVSFTLKELETRINSPGLMRVHRSYIVNCSKVEAIQNNALMIGKNEIPIGKSYRHEVLKHFPAL